MVLDLELKDDFIKKFVDLYNAALKLDDEELMEIFHQAMLNSDIEFMSYCLKKVLNL